MSTRELTFGQEKRFLLGALALIAPLPLPFNQVLEWPVLFLYTALVLYFLQRNDRGIVTTLPNWALNVLGFIYFPILVIDLRIAFARGRIVMALLHLILFLVVVKLYSMSREKDKWHLTIAIFFLFVGAMATSSHVTIVLYFIAFLALSLWLLARFAHLHVLGSDRSKAPDPSPITLRKPWIAGTLIVLMVSIPLFAMMPRFRQPFIFGQGAGGGSGLIRSTGFSDSVDLSLTSSIRGNRQVAFRIKYERSAPPPQDMRFKAIAYDNYRDRQWHIENKEARFVPENELVIDEREAVNRATLYLEPLDSSSLILPVETLKITLSGLPAMTLSIDPGGGISMPWIPPNQIRYDLELSDRPVLSARTFGSDGKPMAISTNGVSEPMEQLARTVIEGLSTDAERIRAIETHLLENYDYTLDFVGRDGQDPLNDFLFVYRSGHCEYFASAMVLMLRSVGIPARLVTGFLGAEYNPLEGYFIVRQQNAHAWVEAYSSDGEWQVYDPTPPDGRPAIAEQSLTLLVGQLYDYLTFRWDRYVLTFGADDQVGVFERLKERVKALRGWWQNLFNEDKPENTATANAPDGTADDTAVLTADQPWKRSALILLGMVALFAAWATWRRLHPTRAEVAYRRLRARLERSGLELDDSIAPLEVVRRSGERYPSSHEPVRRLVELYLKESFAENPLDIDEKRSLGPTLRAASSAIRREDPAKAA